MSTLAIESGGVSFLTAIVASAMPTSLLTDGGSEDNLYLPDFFCQVDTCKEKKSNIMK